MSIRNLALCAIVAAASIQAAAEETVGFRNKHEAVAACKALIETDDSASTKEELDKNAGLCQAVLQEAYELARQKGSEYFVAGIGFFGGVEGNTPRAAYTSFAGQLNYGITVWATYDTEKLTPGLRFTPLVQGVLGVSAVTASPSPIEVSKGFVVFVGRAKKSIFDFNSAYTGVNVEFVSPLSAALTAKNSWQITVMNNNGGGAYAVMGMTTANAGNPAKAIGIREIYSYNYSVDGGGLSFTSALKYMGGKFLDSYEDTKAKLFGPPNN